jgi:4-alpha-glucanotransferase
MTDGSGGGAPASIHDTVKTKEAGLARYLRYDGYERRGGLLRAMPLDATAADWGAGGGPDLADPAAPTRVKELSSRRLVTVAETSIAGQPVRVVRELSLDGGRLDPSLALRVTVEHLGDSAIEARLGIEWPTTMLGGGGNPAAWWEAAGHHDRHDGHGTASDIEQLAQGNDWLGVSIATHVEPAADAWWAPIETISNSESGFERVYQGSGLLLSWPVTLEPGASWSVDVEHRATVAIDRAGMESAGHTASHTASHTAEV